MRLSTPSSSVLVQALSCAVHVTAAATPNKTLPVVDLGYNLHRALEYNSTTEVYKFSNIRYAQAPTGHLRFRAPELPLVNRSVVQDGSEYRACPQAVPHWQAIAYLPIGKYSGGAPFTLEAWKDDLESSQPPPGLLETMNDNVSEDCLFLDVYTTKQALSNSGVNKDSGKGVPVLVWIHGGGFVLGSKSGHPTPYMRPDGLIAEAKKHNPDGLVFVGLNYRLGALGFLAGPELAEDGALNAGLLDQRLALEWVQENIHKFGGDANRVTVMGESGGGGALMYHLAAYGGHDGSAPFSQIISQSPATWPRGEPTNGSYDGFLEAMGVQDLSQARELSEREAIRANQDYIGAAPANTYIFGPVVDGSMIPADIGDSFNSGAFDHEVKVMAAYNTFEGGFFYDPQVNSEDSFREWMARSVAGLSSDDVEHLATDLYPPTFDSSLGYNDYSTRQMTFWSEAIFECSFLLLNQAMNGSSYAYQFAVTPGLHTQDLRYTFDDYARSPAPLAKQILQQSLASFVVNGVPSAVALEGDFPRWGSDEELIRIAENGAVVTSSQVNETRCAWWHNTRL